MKPRLSEKERIEVMLREGKISQEEAKKLLLALEAQRNCDEELAKSYVKRTDPTRKRLNSLFLFCGVFFVIGLLGGLFLSTNGTAEQSLTSGTIHMEKDTNAVQRTIDLSQIEKERRTVMTRAAAFSTILFVLIVLVLTGISVFLFYNRLVDSRERVNSGWAQVENVYQRRLDLVPVLIDGVKTYMGHERDTLTALTEARAKAVGVGEALRGQAPSSVEQLAALESAQGELKSALARFFAVVENYPDLKASQNFLTLQDQIEGAENRISIERRSYNEAVRRYNTRIQKFPSNIFADAFAFEAKPYFQAESRALKSLEDPFGK